MNKLINKLIIIMYTVCRIYINNNSMYVVTYIAVRNDIQLCTYSDMYY